MSKVNELRSWRRGAGFGSREPLAKKVGRGPNTIRRWERGEAVPTYDDCVALAYALAPGLKRPAEDIYRDIRNIYYPDHLPKKKAVGA